MKNTHSVNKRVAPIIELQTVKESPKGHLVFKSFMCEEERVHDDKDFRREHEETFYKEVLRVAKVKYPNQEADINIHRPFITDVTLDMHYPDDFSTPQVLVHFAAEVRSRKEIN